ncbi:hypothetical protein BVRB_3g058250 [Beta vulgaris subsp. vulgaris]|nr:hypothetical protein BVRB_3g058250 [Beta vulgaris subsp. vulgaris]
MGTSTNKASKTNDTSEQNSPPNQHIDRKKEQKHLL